MSLREYSQLPDTGLMRYENRAALLVMCGHPLLIACVGVLCLYMVAAIFESLLHSAHDEHEGLTHKHNEVEDKDHIARSM